nr:hypothetical protein [Tanacetum cinerariifolium]
MRDEHLDTIPEKESDEFIKSSVENLVPNLSETEDERECDVPVCDDFTTFSNLLFDADDDFSSSDDKLILFLMSSPVNSLFLNQFHRELMKPTVILRKKFILLRKLLYDNSSPRHPKEINSKNSDVVIESFSLYPIPVKDSDPYMEEINLFLTSDGLIPPGIDSDYSDSEGDNLFPKILLHDDPILLPNILEFLNVVRIFPPFFTYPVTSLILLSSGSEDIFFDPRISNYHFFSLEPDVSHRSGTFMKFNVYPNHLNEIPMEILSSTCSPMDQ